MSYTILYSTAVSQRVDWCSAALLVDNKPHLQITPGWELQQLLPSVSIFLSIIFDRQASDTHMYGHQPAGVADAGAPAVPACMVACMPACMPACMLACMLACMPAVCTWGTCWMVACACCIDGELTGIPPAAVSELWGKWSWVSPAALSGVAAAAKWP